MVDDFRFRFAIALGSPLSRPGLHGRGGGQGPEALVPDDLLGGFLLAAVLALQVVVPEVEALGQKSNLKKSREVPWRRGLVWSAAWS
jgi:hypothetical protein